MEVNQQEFTHRIAGPVEGLYGAARQPIWESWKKEHDNNKTVYKIRREKKRKENEIKYSIKHIHNPWERRLLQETEQISGQ